MLVKVKWRDGTRSLVYGNNPLEVFWTIDQVGDPSNCEIGVVDNSFIYGAKATKSLKVTLKEEGEHSSLAEEIKSDQEKDYPLRMVQFLRDNISYICLVDESERNRILQLLKSGTKNDFSKLSKKKGIYTYKVQ